MDTGKPTSDNYRRNLIRAVKAAFRWAETEGTNRPLPDPSMSNFPPPSPVTPT